MEDQGELTPSENKILREMIAAYGAQRAEVDRTAMRPRGRLIGRVGRFSAWLFHNLTGALTILLLQSDFNQAKTEWMPTVVAIGESVSTAFDSLPRDDDNKRQQFAALPLSPQMPTPNSGNVVVTPNTVSLTLKAFPPKVVISQSPPADFIPLEGHATISVSARGTLS